MYRNIKHMILSTIMVAVLFTQLLFGTYHVLTNHVDDHFFEMDENSEMLTTLEAQCDLCAKLDTHPFHLDFNIEAVFHSFYIPLKKVLKQDTHLITRFNAIYRRGPPSQF